MVKASSSVKKRGDGEEGEAKEGKKCEGKREDEREKTKAD